MLGSVSGSILAARALISAKNLKECNKKRSSKFLKETKVG